MWQIKRRLVLYPSIALCAGHSCTPIYSLGSLWPHPGFSLKSIIFYTGLLLCRGRKEREQSWQRPSLRGCMCTGTNYIIYFELSTHLPLNKMATILADDIFKCVFLNENDRIPIKISLKFVSKSPIDSKSALVQVMAWYRTGDKPLPELMLTHSLTPICGTRGTWVNMVCIMWFPCGLLYELIARLRSVWPHQWPENLSTATGLGSDSQDSAQVTMIKIEVSLSIL